MLHTNYHCTPFYSDSLARLRNSRFADCEAVCSSILGRGRCFFNGDRKKKTECRQQAHLEFSDGCAPTPCIDCSCSAGATFASPPILVLLPALLLAVLVSPPSSLTLLRVFLLTRCSHFTTAPLLPCFFACLSA